VITHKSYDFDIVVREFLNNHYPERAELVLEVGKAVRSLPIMRMLGSEVAQEAMAGSTSPEQVIAIGLLYGMTIGILLEKEKSSRRLYV
jgi:hypothetical protein